MTPACSAEAEAGMEGWEGRAARMDRLLGSKDGLCGSSPSGLGSKSSDGAGRARRGSSTRKARSKVS